MAGRGRARRVAGSRHQAIDRCPAKRWVEEEASAGDRAQSGREYLDLWADPPATTELLLSAYECYYDVFFAEEEARIRPALEAALARAQAAAQRSGRWEELLEELSQGVRVAKDWEQKTLILGPSYWAHRWRSWPTLSRSKPALPVRRAPD